MQGGGGGRRRTKNTSTPPGDGTDRCILLNATTALQSPDLTVLASLKKGDELHLRLIRDAAGRSLVAIHKQHGEAGTLLPPSLEEIIECMDSGNQYKARVQQLDGAYCEVHIRHASR